MNEIFNESTTAQIDAKLHSDILKHEDNIEKICIIIYFILLFLFRGWIGYWLKFGVAIPYKFESKPVITIEEPVQINYTKDEQAQKTFVYKSLINKTKTTIIPQAKYKISGLTITYNHSSGFINNFYNQAILYDYGTAWGKLGNKQFFDNYYECSYEKSSLSGFRYIRTYHRAFAPPITEDYEKSHWSHSHIIPANRNIMAAFLKIKKWDKVTIEGELVDIEYTDRFNFTQKYKTSLSRTDNGTEGRGSGPAEIIYVTKVKIGNKVYK